MVREGYGIDIRYINRLMGRGRTKKNNALEIRYVRPRRGVIKIL